MAKLWLDAVLGVRPGPLRELFPAGQNLSSAPMPETVAHLEFLGHHLTCSQVNAATNVSNINGCMLPHAVTPDFADFHPLISLGFLI